MNGFVKVVFTFIYFHATTVYKYAELSKHFINESESS